MRSLHLVVIHEKKREVENLFEEKCPPPPTREEEIAYLNWLEKDLRKDKWFGIHFRQRTPGPRRTHLKKVLELKAEQRRKNLTNFIIGAAVAYPFGILFGRRLTHYPGGVPAIIHPVWLPEYPEKHPMHKISRNFWFGVLFLCFVSGYTYQRYKRTMSSTLIDENWNRPDKRPVKPFQQEQEKADGKRRDLYEAHRSNSSYWNPVIKEGNKTSALHRFLFPKTSNWEVKHEPLSDNSLRYKGDGFYTGILDRSTHTWNS